MNNLQKLLDERWPIREDATMADKLTLGSFRMIFSEGYNAAIKEIGGFGAKKENRSLSPFSLLTKFVNQD